MKDNKDEPATLHRPRTRVDELGRRFSGPKRSSGRRENGARENPDLRSRSRQIMGHPRPSCRLTPHEDTGIPRCALGRCAKARPPLLRREMALWLPILTSEQNRVPLRTPTLRHGTSGAVAEVDQQYHEDQYDRRPSDTQRSSYAVQLLSQVQVKSSTVFHFHVKSHYFMSLFARAKSSQAPPLQAVQVRASLRCQVL